MSSTAQGIDDKYLVIQDKTAFPQRCVRTNQPVSDREYLTWDLPWIPLWLKAIMILVPFLLIAMPYAARHRCRFKAGLSRGVRFRYLMLKVAAGTLIVGSLIAPIGYAAVDLTGWSIAAACLFPIAFWGGFAILILFTSPLTITKHQGNYFWIKGCSTTFLESLSDHFPQAGVSAV